MRILLLTLLIAGPLLYFRGQKPESEPEIDAIRTKLGAPERVGSERILTLKPSEVRKPAVEDAVESDGPDPANEESAAIEEPEVETVDEVQLSDLEEGWDNELKSMLGRLEPADGENIFKTYKEEQESYQAEMDALMNEKSQKTSEEASLEVDQLIAQLDERHQYRMKEILGAHYEAVRDQYDRFMETAQSE